MRKENVSRRQVASMLTRDDGVITAAVQEDTGLTAAVDNVVLDDHVVAPFRRDWRANQNERDGGEKTGLKRSGCNAFVSPVRPQNHTVAR